MRLVRFPRPDKERPVVVLTRDAAIQRLATVTVAPITSTVRDVPSEVVLGQQDGMKQICAVNLHNLATVHRSQIGPQVASLSTAKLEEVCRALAFALGCDAYPDEGETESPTRAVLHEPELEWPAKPPKPRKRRGSRKPTGSRRRRSTGG